MPQGVIHKVTSVFFKGFRNVFEGHIYETGQNFNLRDLENKQLGFIRDRASGLPGATVLSLARSLNRCDSLDPPPDRAATLVPVCRGKAGCPHPPWLFVSVLEVWTISALSLPLSPLWPETPFFNFPLVSSLQPSHGAYSTQQPPQISVSTHLMGSPFSHLLGRNRSPHRCVQGRIFVIRFPCLPGSSPFTSSLQSWCCRFPKYHTQFCLRAFAFLILSPTTPSLSRRSSLPFKVLFQCQAKRYFRRMLCEAAIATNRPSLLSVPLCTFPWDLSAATRQILYIHACLICPPTRSKGQ